MAFTNSKPVKNPLHLIIGEGHLPVINRPLIQMVRSKEKKLQAPVTLNISRRDTLLYLTAETVGGLTILSTEPAEARVGRRERKKKIMEKLEMLRKKASLSKSKDENSGPHKNKTLLLPFPNPQEGPISGPLVEAIVP